MANPSYRLQKRLAWLLCLATLVMWQIRSDAAQTLRVDVDLVNVFPTVQDSAGKFVAGLLPSDFKILEDGVEQKISIFEKENVDSAIGVLLDNSLSMVDILPIMKTGLLDFARHKGSFSELFVMTFGIKVRTLHEIGQPLDQLESALKQVGVQGTSALFDALVEGMRKVSGRDPARKALVVFTDGMDTASKGGFKEVRLEAQKTGTLLYFVAIGARVLIDEHNLESLANETGGRVIYLTKSQPIAPAMESIRQDLSKQYYIGYYTRRAPGFHSIKIELPGRDVKIRAKTGYYGS